MAKRKRKIKKTKKTVSQKQINNAKKELLLQDNDFVAAKHLKDILNIGDVDTHDLNKAFEDWKIR